MISKIPRKYFSDANKNYYQEIKEKCNFYVELTDDSTSLVTLGNLIKFNGMQLHKHEIKLNYTQFTNNHLQYAYEQLKIIIDSQNQKVQETEDLPTYIVRPKTCDDLCVQFIDQLINYKDPKDIMIMQRKDLKVRECQCFNSLTEQQVQSICQIWKIPYIKQENNFTDLEKQFIQKSIARNYAVPINIRNVIDLFEKRTTQQYKDAQISYVKYSQEAEQICQSALQQNSLQLLKDFYSLLLSVVTELLEIKQKKQIPLNMVVAYSGGKDSTALLIALVLVKEFILKDVLGQIYAVSYNPCTPAFKFDEIMNNQQCIQTFLQQNLNQPNKQFFKQEQLTFDIIANFKKDIEEQGQICSICARFRRGCINTFCIEHQANLCIGHHILDSLETALMTTIHSSGMFALRRQYTADNGVFTVRLLSRCTQGQIIQAIQAIKKYDSPLTCELISSDAKECNYEVHRESERGRIRLFLKQLSDEQILRFNNVILETVEDKIVFTYFRFKQVFLKKIICRMISLPAEFQNINDPNVLRANLLQLMKQNKEIKIKIEKERREAENYGKILLKNSQNPREIKIQRYRAEKSSLERQIQQLEDKKNQIGDLNIEEAEKKFQDQCQKDKEFYDWCQDKEKVQATIDWIKLQVDQKKSYAQLIKETENLEGSQASQQNQQSSQQLRDSMKSQQIKELKKSKEISESAEKYLQSTQPASKKQFTINELNYNNNINEFEEEKKKFQELLQKREDIYNQIQQQLSEGFNNNLSSSQQMSQRDTINKSNSKIDKSKNTKDEIVKSITKQSNSTQQNTQQDNNQTIQLSIESQTQLQQIGERIQQAKQDESREMQIINQKFGKCLGNGVFQQLQAENEEQINKEQQQVQEINDQQEQEQQLQLSGVQNEMNNSDEVQVDNNENNDIDKDLAIDQIKGSQQ